MTLSNHSSISVLAPLSNNNWFIRRTRHPQKLGDNKNATTTRPVHRVKHSVVHLHLKDEGLCFEHINLHILDREDGWFKGGVKETFLSRIYWKMEKRAEDGKGSRRYFLFQNTCVYQTLKEKFLHLLTVNEPYLIE